MTQNDKIISVKSGILVFATLIISIGGHSQTIHSLTAPQTVDYGVKNAVQVKNALLDVKIQQQVNREFTALAYPQLNGSIGGTHYFNIAVQSLPNFIAPSTYKVLIDEGVKNGNGSTVTMPPGGYGTINAQFGVPWLASGGLELSQILFDGQVFVGLKARSATIDLAQKTVEVTTVQIKANIYKIYWQLVVGKIQLSSIQANIDRFEKLLFDTKEIYKNGFAEKLDVNKITVQLNNLLTEKEKINQQLQAGNAALKFLINMPQKDELILTDTLSEEKLKSNILEDIYNYEDRKEIQLLNTAIKLNGYNVERFRLSRIPTIVAFGSYSKNAQRQDFNFFEKGDWFTTSLAGIKISVPIFDGASRSAKIENAKLTLEKYKNNLQQAKETVDYEASTARVKLKTAILTVDNQKQNKRLAEEVFYSTEKKFQQGLGSNQEIYNAQTELKVSQNNYYGALYDAIIAKVDYLKAIGKL
jgi:outer membrane protein TolC